MQVRSISIGGIIRMIFLAVWFGLGIYGMLANMERVPRGWSGVEPSFGDSVQHFLTLILGPIGIALVMSTGGRIKFWER